MKEYIEVIDRFDNDTMTVELKLLGKTIANKTIQKPDIHEYTSVCLEIATINSAIKQAIERINNLPQFNS